MNFFAVKSKNKLCLGIHWKVQQSNLNFATKYEKKINCKKFNREKLEPPAVIGRFSKISASLLEKRNYAVISI